MVFSSISCNIDEFLLINSSANLFAFGDSNIHHKDWLTYSSGTDRPVELCYQIMLISWLTFLLRSLTVTLTIMLFWIYFFDASICSTMAFPPLGNSNHVVVLVCIDFPTNSKQGALFHCIAHDYSCVDCENLYDHLTDVLWENIATEFCELVQYGIDVYIHHRKYQVKPHSCLWFSAPYSTAIVHRNHFFCLYHQNKSSESKVKFRQTITIAKRVLEAAKLPYATKTKESITSEKRSF